MNRSTSMTNGVCTCCRIRKTVADEGFIGVTSCMGRRLDMSVYRCWKDMALMISNAIETTPVSSVLLDSEIMSETRLGSSGVLLMRPPQHD